MEENSGPAEDLVLALSILIVAVGLAVTGVVLLVTCETAQFVDQFGNVTIGCSYPFQPYGKALLYAAGLLVAVEPFPVRRILLSKGRDPGWNPLFLSGTIAACATFLFFVIYVIV